MEQTCDRCGKDVPRLVQLGDVEYTAWLSSENNLLLPQYHSVCIPCALEALQIGWEDLVLGPENHASIAHLRAEIEGLKSLMIDVATGGPRIQEKNQEYQEWRDRVAYGLAQRQLEDPNPYPDLWAWYGKWSSGDLPSYQSRRMYIAGLYQPLLDHLKKLDLGAVADSVRQPTGWARVDRGVDKTRRVQEAAQSEEDYQSVGLLCRETLISLAQAVFDPARHESPDGIVPSDTDANRMLDAYFLYELDGNSNEAARRHARASLAFAVALQHRRTATHRDAALCAEATRTVVNIVAILSGRR